MELLTYTVNFRYLIAESHHKFKISQSQYSAKLNLRYHYMKQQELRCNLGVPKECSLTLEVTMKGCIDFNI